METIENNKLIAEFMGWTVDSSNYLSPPSGNKIFILPPDLKFNYSWDWLMPVVEKIESLEDNNQNKDYFKQSNKVCGLPIYTKIEAVYNAGVEFIKWHNLNK